MNMKSILLLPAFCLLCLSLSAQWTAETDSNTVVSTATTGDIQSIGTSDGKTWIAYWHEVPAPQYYEMRAQLLDQDGNRMFGEEGIVVNDTVPMSSFTTIWSVAVDYLGNLLIGFNGSDGGNPVFIHKIAQNGAEHWRYNPGSGFDPKVFPLANGEVVVSWLPGNKGVMQKLTFGGVPLWANPVTIEPQVASHRTSVGELAEMSNKDITVILHDRGGFSPSSLPYAQRYDENGTAVWPTPVALTTTYFTVFNRRYTLKQDGDTIYFGYAGAQGIQPHGFLQRVDPDGSLPWGINGSDFSTQTSDYEQDVKIAYTPGADVVWAVCQYSNSAQSQVGEYIQKFDKTTGNRLLSNEAKEVFPVSDAYISLQGNLQLVNDRPVFLVSDGNSNGVFPKDLLAVYLDENGDFVWPEQTRPVATNPTGVKSRIHLNTPYNGKVVAAWTENRMDVGASRAYAQRVEVDSICTPPVAGFVTEGVGTSLAVIFYNTAFQADSMFWDFGDSTTYSGLNTDLIHTFFTEGIFTVCQWVTNECGADTTCSEVTVGASGVSTLEKAYHLKLSPNPGHGDFLLTLDVPEAAELSYQLMTTLGQTVCRRTIPIGSGQQIIPLETGILAAGNYFLRVQVNGKETTLKLVVR